MTVYVKKPSPNRRSAGTGDSMHRARARAELLISMHVTGRLRVA